MSAAVLHSMSAVKIAEAAALVAALSRGMPELIQREIAPHLPECAQHRALELAEVLEGDSCCSAEVASRLAAVLDCIDMVVARGTRSMVRRADGRLVAGREVPILERRLAPEAETLRRVAAPLRELSRQITCMRDLAEAIRNAEWVLKD
jgi:hypothetical protein